MVGCGKLGIHRRSTSHLLRRCGNGGVEVEKESDESIRVIDLEKVAYVLGKGMGEGNDLDDDDDDDDGNNYEDEGNGVEKTVQQGKDKFQAESGTKKRKAKDDAYK